jgi:hypothetical protein
VLCTGTLINVWWPAEESWFPGYADKYDISRGLFVKYLDGDRRFHDLTITTYHVLSEADANRAIVGAKRKLTTADIQQVKNAVECIICMDIFKNPYSLPCTHTFCEDCLKQSFKTIKECPICKEDFVFREARHNPTLDKLCDIFRDPTTLHGGQNATSSFSDNAFNTTTTLSSNPLEAFAQVTCAGT